jgi:ADP-dependent NAD(P)H-hydrate dehydratase / NAD(P)H-hydrate epimerase
MIPVLSRAQIRNFDQVAIEQYHVPGVILMENAGRGACDRIVDLFPKRSTNMVIVCGTGNNGGDGLVVARHLLTRGYQPQVFLARTAAKLHGDALINFQAFQGFGVAIVDQCLTDNHARLVAALSCADVVIDALLGTGLDREVQAEWAQTIALMDQCPLPKIALDIPSGLDCDTGQALGTCIHADWTITFAHYKQGLLTPSGAAHSGKVVPVDIGVPPTLYQETGYVARLITPEKVRQWLATRNAQANKYRVGTVGVIGGSPGKLGALHLASEAALRCGAGLATAITWAECSVAMDARVREVMTARLERGSSLIPSLEQALVKRQAVAIGPGLGLDNDARQVCDHVVFHWPGTKVVDADAITHFSKRSQELAKANGSVILTPHTGELARLLGNNSETIDQDRYAHVREAARLTQATVVLKGAYSLVAHGDELWVNPTGNPCLATGGSGDVLAGMIAALSCSLPSLEAAALGTYLHGLTADMWATKVGGVQGADRGMLATDLIELLPYALVQARQANP